MAAAIWAVLQQREGELHRQSRETVAAAQRLGELVGSEVEAVLLGHEIDEVAGSIAGEMEIAALRVGDHSELAEYRPGVYTTALATAIGEHRPRYLLFPHTYQSMDYFPCVAQSVDGAVVSAVEGFRREGDDLLWRRPVLGGKLQAEVKVRGDGPVLASIQAGAFGADELESGSGDLVALDLDLDGVVPDREVLGTEQAAEGEEVDLSTSEIIVAAGRGVGGESEMEVVRELAEALGADIGASRPVIDSGWLPRDRQIGSSGQTVAPRLYIAAGISGAIQHLVGMKGADCIVAVNKDANAPIFAISDYGIVGDLHEVLPELTAAIRKAKEN